MEKLILEEYINRGLSIRQISKEILKSFTTTRYWINKYELKSKYPKFNKSEYGTHRNCPKCKKSIHIDDFYTRRDKKGSGVYCKQCTKNQTLERVREIKQVMVEYKGGKCERCGYNKYQGALEFHHVDPTKKDFTLSHSKISKLNDRIKDELDKCILVCSNCHKEIHNENVVALQGIEPQSKD